MMCRSRAVFLTFWPFAGGRELKRECYFSGLQEVYQIGSTVGASAWGKLVVGVGNWECRVVKEVGSAAGLPNLPNGSVWLAFFVAYVLPFVSTPT